MILGFATPFSSPSTLASAHEHHGSLPILICAPPFAFLSRVAILHIIILDMNIIGLRPG